MQCIRCEKQATLHITDVLYQDALEELHLCEDCAERHLYEPPTPAVASPSRTPEKVDGGIRFDVVRIIISEKHDHQVVVLREVGGERTLPIVCGIFEATSMDRKLKQMASPRPLTFDAWANTIAALGGELQDAFLTELHDHVYFARLRIRQRAPVNRLVEIDVRPSDALTMAIHHRVGFFIKDQVLAEVLG
jgi:uncharacterized protein